MAVPFSEKYPKKIAARLQLEIDDGFPEISEAMMSAAVRTNPVRYDEKAGYMGDGHRTYQVTFPNLDKDTWGPASGAQ